MANGKTTVSYVPASYDFFIPMPPHPAVEATVCYDFGPSLTRQEFAEEADINVLMARYERTGVMPAINGAVPQYYDFTSMPTDLMSFMEMSRLAEEAFMKLPATIRREFDNDPLAWCDYAADPANLEQMREWGLAKPAELPDAVKEARDDGFKPAREVIAEPPKEAPKAP